MTARGFSLIVQNAVPDAHCPPRELAESAARLVFAGEDGELVLRVVDESESALLNERYRGKRGATNVLAFAPGELPVGADEPQPLGDIVICAAVVAREAEQQGKTLEAHWAHMVLHGCLHLKGYDHTDERDAAAMEACERELLTGLGLPDPYAVEA